MRVTDHFSTEEFAQHAAHGFPSVPYPEEWYDRLRALCEVLEIVRTALGDKSISIMSGYRTAEYNAKIGGAKNSQHIQGRAADIRVAGIPARVVHDTILRLSLNGSIQIGGLGKYSSFVHVDIRPTSTLARWNRSGESETEEINDGSGFNVSPVADLIDGIVQEATSDDIVAGLQKHGAVIGLGLMAMAVAAK
jgi:hypothetical protein